MKLFFVSIVIMSAFVIKTIKGECGCRYLRPCYKQMVKDLLLPDEDPCVENVAIGASTVTIFLKALSEYCDRVIAVRSTQRTHEGRNLYEVVINSTQKSENADSNARRPVILLEAGQDGGAEPVALALFVIEQLVGCGENKEMLKRVQWVILPSTNPDGQEYVRTKREPWKKNYSPNGKNIVSFGVDITRNFDESWTLCPAAKNTFSQDYPGPKPFSEKESVFINDVLVKYKASIHTYVSLRRNGHGIFYPLASKNTSVATIDRVRKRAGEIAAKVNQRAGNIQWFLNQSIFEMNGKPHCGHSVDLAHNKYDIMYAFEMRVFPETDNRIMSKFQALPKGHKVSLRNGYFSGLRELYNLVISDMQFKKT